MKKIYLLITTTLLTFTGLHAQTKTVKHKHTAVKLVPTTNTGKVEYVDFDIKTNTAAPVLSTQSMFASLIHEVWQKKLVAYDNRITYDATGKNIFSKPITYKELMKRLVDTVIVDMIDKDGNKTGERKLTNDFTPIKLTGYRIQRRIITDKATGVSHAIITAIAPAVPLVLSNGDTLTASQPVCWFKFNECKKLLASKLIDGRHWENTTWEALVTGGKVRE